MAKLLTTPVGTPIYDDLGRIIGFSGIPEGSPVVDQEGNQRSYQKLLNDETFSNTSFAKAVDTVVGQYKNYTPPLQAIPKYGKEVNYEDGSSEMMFPTKDLNAIPKNIPIEEPMQQISVKPIKRKYTQQYVPEQKPQQSSYQRAVTGNNKAPQTAQPVQLPATSTNWNSFVEQAKQVAAETGFPLSVLLGQAALETGRKSSPGNNYFGIKGSGSAGSQNLATQEADAGGFYNTRSNFAAYGSPTDSIKAYIDLIKNRYPEAWKLKDNPTAMVGAIKAGGYATDPSYVAKVTSTPEFRKFQNYAPPPPPRPQMPTVRPQVSLAPAQQNVSGQTQFKPVQQQSKMPAPKKAAQPVPVLKHQKTQLGAIGKAVNSIKGLFGIK